MDTQENKTGDNFFMYIDAYFRDMKLLQFIILILYIGKIPVI